MAKSCLASAWQLIILQGVLGPNWACKFCSDSEPVLSEILAAPQSSATTKSYAWTVYGLERFRQVSEREGDLKKHSSWLSCNSPEVRPPVCPQWKKCCIGTEDFWKYCCKSQYAFYRESMKAVIAAHAEGKSLPRKTNTRENHAGVNGRGP